MIKSSGRTRLDLGSLNSIFVGRLCISKELWSGHASLVFGGSSAISSCSPCGMIRGVGGSFVDCVVSYASYVSDVKLTRFVCGFRGTCGFCLAGGGGGEGGESTEVPSQAGAACWGGGVLTFCCVNTASGDGGAACELDD